MVVGAGLAAPAEVGGAAVPAAAAAAAVVVVAAVRLLDEGDPDGLLGTSHARLWTKSPPHSAAVTAHWLKSYQICLVSLFCKYV